MFAYSGTNGIFLPILRSQPVTDADDGNQPGQSRRVSFEVAPPQPLHQCGQSGQAAVVSKPPDSALLAPAPKASRSAVRGWHRFLSLGIPFPCSLGELDVECRYGSVAAHSERHRRCGARRTPAVCPELDRPVRAGTRCRSRPTKVGSRSAYRQVSSSEAASVGSSSQGQMVSGTWQRAFLDCSDRLRGLKWFAHRADTWSDLGRAGSRRDRAHGRVTQRSLRLLSSRGPHSRSRTDLQRSGPEGRVRSVARRGQPPPRGGPLGTPGIPTGTPSLAVLASERFHVGGHHGPVPGAVGVAHRHEEGLLGWTDLAPRDRAHGLRGQDGLYLGPVGQGVRGRQASPTTSTSSCRSPRQGTCSRSASRHLMPVLVRY